MLDTLRRFTFRHSSDDFDSAEAKMKLIFSEYFFSLSFFLFFFFSRFSTHTNFKSMSRHMLVLLVTSYESVVSSKMFTYLM